ncbi:hypothetical protein E2C01_062630 [Portunus trituberculatus]|uniref:Uncharacterized protein n=1 Tax=Portunus trituberculatus TaxID=210409 RepID=A0A5B7HHU6_PORTR|nr:hypothetical protein [Portunus trituberculatus]
MPKRRRGGMKRARRAYQGGRREPCATVQPPLSLWSSTVLFRGLPFPATGTRKSGELPERDRLRGFNAAALV